MRELMDRCTHLGNFPVPVDTRLAHFLVAENDAYVLRDGVVAMETLWPGCQVSILNNRGHIGAYLVNASRLDNSFK